MTVKITLRNKDRLYQGLRKTVPEIHEQLRGALAQGGDEMVEKARQFVPVDEGDLRNSIFWDWTRKTKDNDSRSPAIVVTAGADELDRDAFYASFIEHGTVKAIRRPFFFPAWRLVRRKIRGRMSRAMTRAIKKAGFGNG